MTNKKPLVSIIVPVYNTEKFLKPCVESIINQTYKNIEIILVDDGSPDNCPAMCDEFAKKDKRVAVFHKENGGQSSARNLAIKHANGEYLSFIDSDDTIKENFIERLLTAALSADADICCSGINYLHDDSSKDFVSAPNVEKDTIVEKDDIISSYYEKYYNNFLAVTYSLYKKSLFENDLFAEGYIYEDLEINLRLLSKCNRIVLINDALYVFYAREDSTTNSAYSKRKVDCHMFVLNSHVEFLQKNGLNQFISHELIKRFNDFAWTYRNIPKDESRAHLKTEVLKHWKKYKKHLSLLNPKHLKTFLNILYLKLF